jgi:hypothetical protein
MERRVRQTKLKLCTEAFGVLFLLVRSTANARIAVLNKNRLCSMTCGDGEGLSLFGVWLHLDFGVSP